MRCSRSARASRAHAARRRALAFAWTGAGGAEHWSGGARDVDFFDIKGVVERVVRGAATSTAADRDRIAELAGAGRRRPQSCVRRRRARRRRPARPSAIAEAARACRRSDAVYVAEIDLDAARPRCRTTTLQRRAAAALSRRSTRDISILVDDTLRRPTVRANDRSARPATLVRVREFDRYQGKGIPDGKVSLSLRLTFRSADRTLTDAEVQSAMDDVLAALQERTARCSAEVVVDGRRRARFECALTNRCVLRFVAPSARTLHSIHKDRTGWQSRQWRAQ